MIREEKEWTISVLCKILCKESLEMRLSRLRRMGILDESNNLVLLPLQENGHLPYNFVEEDLS